MRITGCLTLTLCGVTLWGCARQGRTDGSGSGGSSSSGGSFASTVSSGGTISRGGASQAGSGGATAGSGGDATGGSGGATATGRGGITGATSTGGTSTASGGATGVGGDPTSTGGQSGSTGTVAPCANGVQDPGETGIDCGGTCPACPVDYKTNPPSQCQNRYFYPNCKAGDRTTDCAGVCQPRNACENAPSKDGTVGFACSRYMLFSPMMLQAAKDDGAKNGWDGSNPPFHYAVVGHDTNTGGIDKGMTGNQPCCECYQLIFDQPFNEGGAQSNQASPPKPLIVQTFNLGATTDSFDIYMGTGGFGAFNGCMDGTIKSSAGYALYDAYPADGQPGDGGVKYRRYDECRTANEKITTDAAISSAACQDKIAGLCRQVKSSKSAELASTTQDSCIRSNQVGTAYHQNWAVYAKRVECPENLTRVTGMQAGCGKRARQGRRQGGQRGAGQGRRIPRGVSHHHHARLLQACMWLGGKSGWQRRHEEIRRAVHESLHL
jgi:hypothetical protein